jgi:hypothetical protein
MADAGALLMMTLVGSVAPLTRIVSRVGSPAALARIAPGLHCEPCARRDLQDRSNVGYGWGMPIPADHVRALPAIPSPARFATGHRSRTG